VGMIRASRRMQFFSAPYHYPLREIV
jgi:hypothetical protein